MIIILSICAKCSYYALLHMQCAGRTRPLGLRGRPDADHPDGFFPFPPANLKTTEMYERGGVTKAAAESMCLKADCEGEVDKPVARMWADKAPRGAPRVFG